MLNACHCKNQIADVHSHNDTKVRHQLYRHNIKLGFSWAMDGLEIVLWTIFLHFGGNDSHFNIKPGGTTTTCNWSSSWSVFYACWSLGHGYTRFSWLLNPSLAVGPLQVDKISWHQSRYDTGDIQTSLNAERVFQLILWCIAMEEMFHTLLNRKYSPVTSYWLLREGREEWMVERAIHYMCAHIAQVVWEVVIV